MDLDPLTADRPERTAREEEELEAEEGAARDAARPPVALWTPASRSAMRGGVLTPKLLVFAASPEACALLRPACDAGQLAGALVLPGASMAGNRLPPASTDASCCLYWAGDGSGGGGGGGDGDSPSPAAATTTLIAACQYRVPDGRAGALAGALMEAVAPEAVMVLASLPAHLLPGSPLSPTTVISLHTDAGAALAAAPRPPPRPLPAGVALGGVAAALFSRAQASATPALVLALPDERAGPPAAGPLAALAAAASAVASAAGGGAHLAAALTPKAAAAAVTAGEEADAVSARAAVYV